MNKNVFPIFWQMKRNWTKFIWKQRKTDKCLVKFFSEPSTIRASILVHGELTHRLNKYNYRWSFVTNSKILSFLKFDN